MRAAIYTRISRDSGNSKAGVKRQRDDCDAFCLSEGFKVLDYFVDNDESAYSGKTRPEYQRMVKDVAAGKFDVVVAWHNDRLWRSVVEQTAFMILGQSSSLKLIATCNGNRYDPDDADDEFMLTIQTAVAQKSSADQGRRISRKQKELVEQGRYLGGRRSYGYEVAGVSGLEIVPKEAAVIRDIATRLLSGSSTMSIIRDLNDRKIPALGKSPWSSSALRSAIQRPRLAGLISYHGEIFQGKWEPILTVDEHERLVAMFAARTRSKSGEESRAVRKYLLSGLVRCDRCGSRMYGKSSGRPDGETYACSPTNGFGCGHTAVAVRRVDPLIVELTAKHLDSVGFAKAIKRAERVAAKDDKEYEKAANSLRLDRVRLAEIEADYADSVMDRNEYRRLRTRLEDRINVTSSTLERSSASGAASTLVGGSETFLKAWPDANLLERRELLDLFVEKIIVKKSTTRGHNWDSSRIEVVWRFS